MGYAAVRYSFKVQGTDQPFAVSPEEGAQFVVQEGHVCKALPIAVKKMKLGERASLLIRPACEWPVCTRVSWPAGGVKTYIHKYKRTYMCLVC